MGSQRVGHNLATQKQQQIKIYLLLELMFSGVYVTQSGLTLWYPMDYSPPDSSARGIFQARRLEYCHSLLQGIFQTQGSNLGLLHCRQILYHLSH